MKLAMESAESARAMLERAGFKETRPRTFEANVVYDTPQESLKNSRRLLRLREFDGDNVLTYKGPPIEGPHKSREEIETTVASASQFHQILDRLGFAPMFRYEKYRTVFERPGETGAAVLDETPIGVFVELEGPAGWIDRTAQEMGIGVEKYITESYGSLYRRHCDVNGVPPAHMVFVR